jgi:hypothetical protein
MIAVELRDCPQRTQAMKSEEAEESMENRFAADEVEYPAPMDRFRLLMICRTA